jgi:nucleotide-binding universal stress UspA family protein
MKFHHILFPIDFSDHCRSLNPQVEWLALRFGSRVTLLHVFEIPASWYGTSEAPLFSPECLRSYVDFEEQRLREYKLNVPENRIERVIAEGGAAWHITNRANEQDVDLIVMGTRGLGNVRGFLMGSVAAKVIHDAGCPVWTDAFTHPDGPRRGRGYRKIVCAIDTTDEAVSVLRFARELGHEFGAQVHICHGVPAAETRPSKYFDFDLHAYLMDSARVAISKLQREAGTDFSVSIKASRIADAVSEAAREQNADLVVIGRGKAHETFGRLRTHAYQIIRDAPCPVLSCLSGQETSLIDETPGSGLRIESEHSRL